MFPSSVCKDHVYKCVCVTVNCVFAVCCNAVCVKVVHATIDCLPTCESCTINIVRCFVAIITSIEAVCSYFVAMTCCFNNCAPVYDRVANFTICFAYNTVCYTCSFNVSNCCFCVNMSCAFFCFVCCVHLRNRNVHFCIYTELFV